MWFDAQKALAEIEGGDLPLSGPALPAAQPPAICPRVAVVASVAAPLVRKQKNESPACGDMQTYEAFLHGRSTAGRPLTWTGRIVSLDEWRRLTAWERDGPRGRLWNGITKQWESSEGKSND
ncbi:hypothetical protein [Pontibaca salina]|uniref:Uncharacterized protein n=1 Tax=Pontibaca salina TaxID=2795731 RepID=A0A934LYH0_9RHOB|nr:hypothetical protein [Pontibaca salina]MBI6629742.1 hypothetical protein [Pontibaca salina]